MTVALDRILNINASSDTKKNVKAVKKKVFTYFNGAPGTFDEKCKTIFMKNVKHFYIFRRGSHLYGQRTCDNLWKLGKPLNILRDKKKYTGSTVLIFLQISTYLHNTWVLLLKAIISAQFATIFSKIDCRIRKWHRFK